MDIVTNTQVDKDWPVESLTYRVGDGAEAVMELAFTPADLLACEHRFDDQFWHVDRSQWHDDMLPLGAFIRHGHAGSDAAIPYVVTVDENGLLGRAVVARGVLATVLKTRALWHDLQENGGINNSFAERLLTQEKQRLEAEKQNEVEAIETDYAEQLDQDIGDLTKEIVQRVVGRLLSQEGVSSAPSLPTAPAVATTATPASATAGAEAAPVEDADDDIASFDDPYIDTPLCTSCNECTQMNPQLFAYNENKQAFIKDASGGTFQELVRAAEICPVHIIHPGKPMNPGESGLDELVARAARFN